MSATSASGAAEDGTGSGEFLRPPPPPPARPSPTNRGAPVRGATLRQDPRNSASPNSDSRRESVSPSLSGRGKRQDGNQVESRSPRGESHSVRAVEELDRGRVDGSPAHGTGGEAEQIAALTAALRVSEALRDRHAQQVDSLQQESDALKLELEALNTELDHVNSQRLAAEANAESYKKDLNTITEDMLALKLAQSRAAAELERARQEAAAVQAAADGQAHSLEQSSLTAKQQLEAVQKLKKTVGTQQGIIVDVFRELVSLAQLVETLTGASIDLPDTASGTPEVIIATANASSLTRVLASAISAHLAKAATVVEASATPQAAAEMAARAAELEEKIEAQAAEIVALKAGVAAGVAALEASEGKAAAAEAKVAEKEAAVADIGKELWHCGAELNALQQAFAAQTLELEKVQSTAAGLQKKLSSQRADRLGKAGQLAEMAHENELLKEQIRDLTNRMADTHDLLRQHDTETHRTAADIFFRETEEHMTEWESFRAVVLESETMRRQVDSSLGAVVGGPQRAKVAISIAKAAVLEADIRSREAESLRARVAALEEEVTTIRAALLSSHESVKAAQLDAEQYHKELSEMKWKMMASGGGSGGGSNTTTKPNALHAVTPRVAPDSPSGLPRSLSPSKQSTGPGQGSGSSGSASSLFSPSRPGASQSTAQAISMMRAAVMGEHLSVPALSTHATPSLVRAAMRVQQRAGHFTG